MPWCDQCNRFLNPPSMTPEGACPTCGKVIAPPDDDTRATSADVKVPWHFKLLLVALAIYLLFRLWQGVAWLAHRL